MLQYKDGKEIRHKKEFTCMVQVYLTCEQMDFVEEQSFDKNMKLSTYIRSLVEKEMSLQD